MLNCYIDKVFTIGKNINRTSENQNFEPDFEFKTIIDIIKTLPSDKLNIHIFDSMKLKRVHYIYIDIFYSHLFWYLKNTLL